MTIRIRLFNAKTSALQLDIAALILRLGFGILMIPNHGWKKLVEFDALSQNFMSFAGLSPAISLSLCIFAEFFCSILIILGLMTRWAVLPLILTMFVIFDRHEWELLGKHELATAFMIGYLAILLIGGGRFSMDALLSSSKR